MAGIYVHIPFCKSRCIYCGFYSTVLTEWRDRYVDALCKEITSLPSRQTAETIYIGGGTPSQLLLPQLQRLFAALPKTTGEVTIECNPDDITPEFAEGLASLPVNRVSMGAQTFDNNRLHFLRRRHTAEQVPAAVSLLRKAGIRNISIDLMFGFPGETLSEWQSDILKAVSLGVEHISAYSLMYEEVTPLYSMKQRGEIVPVDEELSLRMYEVLIDELAKAGFEHYEISNFARAGYRSRHNSSYWNSIPYIGIGAAAHSYDGNSRWWNISDVREYCRRIENGESPVEEREVLDEDTRFNDLVMTRLRTCEGIDISNAPFRQQLLRDAEKHLRGGLLILDGNRLRLTRKGLFVSDMVMSDLMRV